MRDDKWLSRRLELLLLRHFSEVDISDIEIRFYGRARGRLGSIRKIDKTSLIRVNGLLAEPVIPDFVIDEVIAHEAVHYVHGFGSSRERLYKYPHRGGIVERELESRGAGQIVRQSKKWLKSNWKDHLDLFLAK